MAINKLSFPGGQVVNPLSAFGDDLQKFGSNLRQQELDRLAAERQANADRRAQEQLDMQKQQYVDQQAAKAAGSKYMADLGRTMEAGVVSQADQGKLAALSQRQDISPEERAKQIDALLPKMSDAYQKDTGAQLQLMRGVVAAPTMDARDKVALYGSMADPLEKKLSRSEDNANRLAEIKEQDRLAGIRQQAGFTHSENLAKTASEEAKTRSEMALQNQPYTGKDNKTYTGLEVWKMTDEERKRIEPIHVDAKKALAEPKNEKTYGVVNDNGIYRAPKEGEKPTEFVEASVFNKIIDNDEKSTGSTLAKTLSDFSSGGMLSTDHKAAATSAANEAGKLLNAANVPLSKANSIINAAVLAAKDKEGTFNKEVFDLAIQQGMLSKGVAKGAVTVEAKSDSNSKGIPAPNENVKKPQELTKSEQERARLIGNLKQSEKDLTEVASRYYSVIGGDPKVKKELDESKQHVARLKKELASLYDPTEEFVY